MTDLDNNTIIENLNIDMTKYKVIEEKIIVDKNGKERNIIIVEKKKQTAEYTLKAVHKYIENNKKEIYKKNGERIKERYKNDEEYRERVKQQKRESYQRSKLKKESEQNIENKKD